MAKVYTLFNPRIKSELSEDKRAHFRFCYEDIYKGQNRMIVNAFISDMCFSLAILKVQMIRTFLLPYDLAKHSVKIQGLQ